MRKEAGASGAVEQMDGARGPGDLWRQPGCVTHRAQASALRRAVLRALGRDRDDSPGAALL
jgi:hypothetical protein